MTTLLTGFNRFGDLEVNPTQLIVESLAKRPGAFTNVNLVAEVLPTEFIGAGNRISQLIRQHRPEMVVCLGLGASLGEIHLERVALNLDDGGMPDNAGVSRTGQAIVPDGPLAYQSTLPLVQMREALRWPRSRKAAGLEAWGTEAQGTHDTSREAAGRRSRA